LRPLQTPAKIGRALADRLHHRRSPRAATLDDARQDDVAEAVVPASRARRLQRFLGASRVSPYQLRRGWLW